MHRIDLLSSNELNMSKRSIRNDLLTLLGAAFIKCKHISYSNVALTQLLDIESVLEPHISTT